MVFLAFGVCLLLHIVNLILNRINRIVSKKIFPLQLRCQRLGMAQLIANIDLVKSGNRVKSRQKCFRCCSIPNHCPPNANTDDVGGHMIFWSFRFPSRTLLYGHQSALQLPTDRSNASVQNESNCSNLVCFSCCGNLRVTDHKESIDHSTKSR